MVDYKKQILITGIKINIQCSICHFIQKKMELVTWFRKLRTYQSSQIQLNQHCNNLSIQ